MPQIFKLLVVVNTGLLQELVSSNGFQLEGTMNLIFDVTVKKVNKIMN